MGYTMITFEQFKGLMPFSRIGFTYSSAHKMLVNGTDGTKSTDVYPDGVTKIADYVVGVGTELVYTDMVKTAAIAQNVSERDLANAFIGKPLKGYEWVDGLEGALLRSIKSGELQLRGYAIDTDGVIPAKNVLYINNATGEKINFENDLKRYMSTAPSAVKKREIQYLEINGIVLLSVDGTKIIKPACKNFALSKITNLVVDP